MKGGARQRPRVISRKLAISLLYPIAAFFQTGGMERDESIAALTVAIDRVCRSERRRRMEHIGAPASYADIIGAWTRETRFLDSSGRPRILRLNGASGFGALVKTTSPGSDPAKVLDVLMRYRNVRRLARGRIQLVSPYFHTSTEKKMAFEPIAYFLSDATSTLTRILRTAPVPSTPEMFWRKVESAEMTKTKARKFAQFAKERSLLFLEELEDWLQAHGATTPSRSREQQRIGIGLFSYYSSIDGIRRVPY